jgi:hypothetical protein
MDRAGLDMVCVFNILQAQWVQMSQAEAQAYIDDVDPLGIMLSGSEVGILGGTTPQSPGRSAVSVADAEAGIAELSAGWDHDSPLFLSIYMIAWDTSPSDVVEIANSLGPDYVIVRADQYFELIREATTTWPNLALEAATTASGALPENPPSMAVDGGSGTYWNSGDLAPQWIEIDLGRPQTIGRISLLTAQLPDGDTVHRVLGKGSAGDPYRLLHAFAGLTTEHQWLHYAPPKPWVDVRFVRVWTTVSPSWVAWKEIRLYPPT